MFLKQSAAARFTNNAKRRVTFQAKPFKPFGRNIYEASLGKLRSMIDANMMSQLTALLTVIGIDIVLAGDNAVVVGMAAAGLPKELRAKAIMIGIIAAMVMRIGFSVVAVEMMGIVGLMAAGGVLLLWVSWKLYREIRESTAERAAPVACGDDGNLLDKDFIDAQETSTKTLRQAVIQILVADLTMSLDNVLAVAGAARDHTAILVFGLILSVALMGIAATWIAKLLNRHGWIAYAGLVLIVYVALHMIWDGAHQVAGIL